MPISECPLRARSFADDSIMGMGVGDREGGRRETLYCFQAKKDPGRCTCPAASTLEV